MFLCVCVCLFQENFSVLHPHSVGDVLQAYGTILLILALLCT
jgi:hypothetical protein